MATKLGYELYGVWKKKYKAKHGTDYLGNKYRDSATLESVAQDLGKDEILSLLDFYFENKANHEVVHFIYNYDSLVKEQRAAARDRARRERIRNRTEQRLKELGIEL